MTAPSWLPTWPTNWPDFVSRYVEAVPQAWKRTYEREGLVFADLQAIGEALSAPRRLLEWVLRTFLPLQDVEGLWLHLWEDDFGISPAATIAERQARLAMRARLLNKTSTVAVVKAVFAEVFGCLPSEMSIAHVSQTILAEINTLGDQTAARWNNSYHVYPTNQSETPNKQLGDLAVQELEPAVGRITYGRPKAGEYRSGTYRHCCYVRH